MIKQTFAMQTLQDTLTGGGNMNWTDVEIDEMYGLIGERVRLERGRARMTQAALAQTAGLTRSSIANIEAGRQRTQVHNLFMIAQALGVPTRQLLPEEAQLAATSQLSVPQYDLSGQPDTTHEFVSDAIQRTTGR